MDKPNLETNDLNYTIVKDLKEVLKEDNYNPRGNQYGEDRTYKQMQKIIDSLLKDYEEDIDD